MNKEQCTIYFQNNLYSSGDKLIRVFLKNNAIYIRNTLFSNVDLFRFAFFSLAELSYTLAPGLHVGTGQGMGELCLNQDLKWSFSLVMKNVQYRHLIPAPVDRTSASAWLHKQPWITCRKICQEHQ